MGAKRHTPRRPAGGAARRDRGKGRDHYLTGGTVTWPTMADGIPWTADVVRVTHRSLNPEYVGMMARPELVDDQWTAVVEWPPSRGDSGGWVRHPLDNLRPA